MGKNPLLQGPILGPGEALQMGTIVSITLTQSKGNSRERNILGTYRVQKPALGK